jgi:hypothetical protein
LFEEKLTVLIVLVGFYLADCIIVLRPTQALGAIALGWRSLLPWRARPATRGTRPGSIISLNFGLTFYPVRGYFPALLNPLTPWVTAFKTQPLLPPVKNDARRVPIHRVAAARLSIRMLGFLLASHAGLLFVAIPTMLFKGQIERMLTFLAFDFLVAAGIIAMSYPLIRILRLRRAQFWSLAIQSLICLPLSLNFPRKLALQAPPEADAASLMSRVPGRDRWRLAQDFIAVLEYARNTKPEAADSARLTDVLSTLRKEVPVE